LKATAPTQELLSIGPFKVLPLMDPKARRLYQLVIGLIFFGVAISLSIEADLGTNPWSVFHVGAGDLLGLSVGTMVTITALVLVLLFAPLREPLGIGTVLNIVVIGISVDMTSYILPDLNAMPVRLAALGIAPVLLGFASGLYIGAGLGPGPRDGLMTALERRGLPIWLARTTVEVTALTLGWILGGPVGLGTVWMAGTVGFWVQLFLPPLRVSSALMEP
jgi:uncharacterized membrane protein YczE